MHKWKDEKRAIQIEAQAAVDRKIAIQGIPRRQQESASFDEVCEIYMEQHNHCKYKMRELLTEFGGRNMDDISPLDITRYRKKILARCKPTSWNRTRNTLNSIFNRGIEWGLCRNNPVRAVKGYPDEKVKEFLTAEHADALLREAKKHDFYLYAFMHFAFKTGRRVSEILRVEWSDVDFERQRIRFLIGKKRGGFSEESRRPPGAVFETLRLLRKINGEKPFPYFPRRGWRKIRDAVDDTLQLPDRRFHAIRHRCGTEMIENGATLYDVQYYLAHSSPQTTMIYAHVSDKRDEKIASFLD